ncbi:MAG: hypothetical protein ACRCSB_04160 [Bacteroidales bacterium]
MDDSLKSSIIVPMIIIGIVVILCTWVIIEMLPLLRRVRRGGGNIKDIPKGIKAQRQVRARAKKMHNSKN